MSENGIEPAGDLQDTDRPVELWQSWLTTLRGRPAPKKEAAPSEIEVVISEEIIAPPPASLGHELGIDWQGLWLAMQRRPWASLAVIPAGKKINTPLIARALARVGSCHLGTAIMAPDATSITLPRLEASIEAWIEHRVRVQRVVLALGHVLENPASLAVARAADAALVCVTLGESSISDVTRMIEEVGRERFLGSVIVAPGRVGR